MWRFAVADPSRRTSSKLKPLVVSGKEGKASPETPEEKSPSSLPSDRDAFRVFLHERARAASSGRSVTVQSPVKPAATASAKPVSGPQAVLMSMMPSGVRLPARSPQLSASAQHVLSLLPRHKLKHLTAEQLRVLTRSVETGNVAEMNKLIADAQTPAASPAAPGKSPGPRTPSALVAVVRHISRGSHVGFAAHLVWPWLMRRGRVQAHLQRLRHPATVASWMSKPCAPRKPKQ